MLAINFEDLITAIGDLWKLTACLVVLFAIFIFRKPIIRLLESLRRFKQGNTEIEIDRRETTPEPLDNSSSQPVEEIPPNDDSDSDEALPQETPITINPEYEIITSLIERDYDAAEQNLKKLIEENPEDEVKHTVSFHIALLGIAPTESTLDEIKLLTTNQRFRKFWSSLHYALGSFFQRSLDLQKADELYKKAYDTSENDDQRVSALIARSKIISKIENNKAAEELIIKEIENTQSRNGKASLLHRLSELYETAGNSIAQAAIIDHIAFLKPGDEDALFNAAFAASSAGAPHLALQNYSLLLSRNPQNDGAQNNLGIVYKNLGLPAHSVDCYKRAISNGSSLAASNLALTYLDVGLVEEAVVILEEAQKESEYHKNIDGTLSKARNIRENETQTIAKIDEKGLEMKAAFRSYFDALAIAV